MLSYFPGVVDALVDYNRYKERVKMEELQKAFAALKDDD